MTTFPDRMGSDGISGGTPTPGPWQLGEWERNIWVGGGPNNDDIAEFNFADAHTVKITKEEAIANARLTAAAPEMLAALALLLADVADYPAWQRPCHAVDVARAAIAKATGGQS